MKRLFSRACVVSLCTACVPRVMVERTPCPCGDGYFCCPEGGGSGVCYAHDDATCWSDETLTVPTLIHYFEADTPRGVYAVGLSAFVVNGQEGLLVYDLARSPPGSVGTYSAKDAVTSVSVRDAIAYLAVDGGGLETVSLDGLPRPQQLYRLRAGHRSLHVHVEGDYAYLSNDRAGIKIVDVADPSFPRHVVDVASRGPAELPDGMHYSGARQVHVVAPYAYIADGDGGLHIIDVTDPSGPLHVTRFPEDRFDSPGSTEGVVFEDGIAYLADSVVGLQIVDASAPKLPSVQGTFPVPCDEVAVTGHYALIGLKEGWVLIVDVSRPTEPTLAGAYDARGAITQIVVVDGRGYVTATGSGLHVIDLTWAGE